MKEVVQLGFDKKHAQKMLGGKGVCQLTPEYISGSKGEKLTATVRKPVATRLRKAMRAGKSARVRLDELEGEGIKEFFQKLKEVGQKIKGGVERFVKPVLGNVLKEATTRGVDFLASKAQPFLPEQVNKLIQENKGKAVEAIGSTTGAFGLAPYPYLYGGAVMMPAVYYPAPMSNWSTQAMPLSGQMQSKLPYAGFGLPAGIPGGEPVEMPSKRKAGGRGFRVI